MGWAGWEVQQISEILIDTTPTPHPCLLAPNSLQAHPKTSYEFMCALYFSDPPYPQPVHYPQPVYKPTPNLFRTCVCVCVIFLRQ